MQDRVILVQEEPRGPSQLIEIAIPIGIQTQNFPDIQQLRSTVNQRIIIKCLRLIPNTVLTNGMTIAGLNAVLGELQKMSLIIYCEGWEKGQLIPILTLNDFFTEASGIPYRMPSTRFNNWENVDWGKTKIVFANGTVSAGAATYVVMIDAEYIKLDGDNNEIIGPSN